MNPFEKDSLKPELIDEVLTDLSEIDDGNTYRLAANAKKISKGKGTCSRERISFYFLHFTRRMQLQMC